MQERLAALGRAEGNIANLIGAAQAAQAVTAYRAALEVYTRQAHPVNWATTQNNLGCTLSDQADREEGAAETAFSARAVTAFRATLEVYTHEAHPVNWAMTQNNLAVALWQQAASEEGPAGAALLA